MADLNEKMETAMESGDQDFLEIQLEEDMNDLDEDNSAELSRNDGAEQPQDKAGTRSSKSTNRSHPVSSADQDLELDSDAEIDREGTNEDAEDEEMELMSMPSLQSVMSEMSQLKQKRRVLVHPIKVQELGHPKVLEIISKVSCEEIKLHFVRPQDKPEEWHGILLMHFGSTRSARLASENLKSVRSDLNIRSNHETAYANRSMECWVKEEKGQKRWTDTLLLVKNIPEDVSESQLFEAFAGAEDVTICSRAGKKSSTSNTKEAFVVYRDGESAQNAAKTYRSDAPVINGQALKVLKYHIPQDFAPKGLLKLKERRLVLKYLEKLSNTKQKSESDVVPTWCSQRLERCRNVIDKDNRVRKSAGLPVPSLEELRSEKGIKVFRGKECIETLVKLGILPASTLKDLSSNKRRRPYTYDNEKESSEKPRSLLSLKDPLGSTSFSRSKYPSLLGDVPSLFMVPSKPPTSQWTGQIKPVNPAISKLLPVSSLLSQMGSVNTLASQAAYIKQQNAINFMSLMKQQQSSNSTKGKTPLLASPESLAPYVSATSTKVPLLDVAPTSAKIPLLGMEPASKMLRLDATGAFCYDFKGPQLGAKSSRSSKPVSFLNLF